MKKRQCRSKSVCGKRIARIAAGEKEKGRNYSKHTAFKAMSERLLKRIEQVFAFSLPPRETAAGHERPETAGTGIFIIHFQLRARGAGPASSRTKRKIDPTPVPVSLLLSFPWLLGAGRGGGGGESSGIRPHMG